MCTSRTPLRWLCVSVVRMGWRGIRCRRSTSHWQPIATVSTSCCSGSCHCSCWGEVGCLLWRAPHVLQFKTAAFSMTHILMNSARSPNTSTALAHPSRRHNTHCSVNMFVHHCVKMFNIYTKISILKLMSTDVLMYSNLCFCETRLKEKNNHGYLHCQKYTEKWLYCWWENIWNLSKYFHSFFRITLLCRHKNCSFCFQPCLKHLSATDFLLSHQKSGLFLFFFMLFREWRTLKTNHWFCCFSYQGAITMPTLLAAGRHSQLSWLGASCLRMYLTTR